MTSKTRSDGTPNKINGLAYIKGICGFHQSSMVVDFGMHGTIQTAAHELGHK